MARRTYPNGICRELWMPFIISRCKSEYERVPTLALSHRPERSDKAVSSSSVWPENWSFFAGTKDCWGLVALSVLLSS